MSAATGEAVVTRFGTHWRWRAILVLASVAVFAVGWNVVRWWTSRFIVEGSGEPAIVLISGEGRHSLKSFDWTAGRWRHIAEILGNDLSIRVVLDGQAVGWYQKDRIYIAPIDGSGVRTSKPFKLGAPKVHDLFLGVTRDEHFAMFCMETESISRLADGGTALTQLVTVVDLRSGNIASAENWVTGSSSVGSTGEIIGTRLFPEAHGRWNFSSDQGWEKVADEKERLDEQHNIFVVRAANGQFWTRSRTPTAATPQTESWTVTSVSPSGDRFIANCEEKNRCAIFDENTRKVTALDLPWGWCPSASFSEDNNTVLVADLLDDIRVIDAASGRLIAKDSAGSRRRAILLGIAVIGLLMSATWLRIALSEESTRWAMADALATTLIISLAMVAAARAGNHPRINWGDRDMRMILQIICFVPMGMSAGTAVVTGWYWAHGGGVLVARWVIGALWMAVLLVPLPLLGVWEPWWHQVISVASTLIFSAGITAIVVWIPNISGWSLRNRPIHGAHRFGLGAIFGATTSAGILLALGRWLIDPSQWDSYKFAAYAVTEMMVVGAVLFGILFLRLPWYWVTGGFLSVTAVVVAAIWLGLAGIAAAEPTLLGRYAIELGGLIGTMLAVVVQGVMLRRHGFRWTRTVTPLHSPSAAPA